MLGRHIPQVMTSISYTVIRNHITNCTINKIVLGRFIKHSSSTIPRVKMLCVSLIVYAVAGVHAGTAYLPTSDDVTQLHSDLFQDYNPSVRPIRNQSDAIPVTVYFDINVITELSDRNQLFWFSGSLTLQWTDELLSWNVSRYGGVEAIQKSTAHSRVATRCYDMELCGRRQYYR
jgi:hypothetical protein